MGGAGWGQRHALLCNSECLGGWDHIPTVTSAKGDQVQKVASLPKIYPKQAHTTQFLLPEGVQNAVLNHVKCLRTLNLRKKFQVKPLSYPVNSKITFFYQSVILLFNAYFSFFFSPWINENNEASVLGMLSFTTKAPGTLKRVLSRNGYKEICILNYLLHFFIDFNKLYSFF